MCVICEIVCIIKGKTCALWVFRLKYADKLHTIKTKPPIIRIERLEPAICIYISKKPLLQRYVIAIHKYYQQNPSTINIYFILLN